MKIDHSKKVIVPIRSTHMDRPSFVLVFYGLRQPEITHDKVYEALETRGLNVWYIPVWESIHEEHTDYHRLSIDGRKPQRKGVSHA